MELNFDESEIKAIKTFFSSAVGQKVIQALDNRAEEKNNLLNTVNLTGGMLKPEQTGIRCQMFAAEVQAWRQAAELLKDFGDYYAD